MNIEQVQTNVLWIRNCKQIATGRCSGLLCTHQMAALSCVKTRQLGNLGCPQGTLGYAPPT